MNRTTRFQHAFWRNYAQLYPCTPKADHFLRGYGGANPTYHIEDRDDLYVKQWLGTETVGTDVRGAAGADVEALMTPYRERFKQEFASDYAGNGSPWGPPPLPWFVMYFKPKGGTRNWWRWDDMAKWLEEYRERYMDILRSGHTASEIRMREAARERFSSPIISHLWHPDGTPFSDEEYRERGIDPPPPGEQEHLIILDADEEEHPED